MQHHAHAFKHVGIREAAVLCDQLCDNAASGGAQDRDASSRRVGGARRHRVGRTAAQVTAVAFDLLALVPEALEQITRRMATIPPRTFLWMKIAVAARVIRPVLSDEHMGLPVPDVDQITFVALGEIDAVDLIRQFPSDTYPHTCS
jgi:hypothetical protein